MESRSTSEPSLIRFSHVQLNYAAISWPEDTQCPNTNATTGTDADLAGEEGFLYFKLSFHKKSMFDVTKTKFKRQKMWNKCISVRWFCLHKNRSK